MKKEKWENKSYSGYILVFIVAAVLLVFLGNMYRKNEERVWKRQVVTRLQKVADYKTKQVERWKTRVYEEASELAENPALQKNITGWLIYRDKERFDSVREGFQLLPDNNPDFSNVFVAGLNGEPLFAANDSARFLPAEKALAQTVARSGKEAFGDFYKNELTGEIFLDLAFPVRDRQKQVQAVLVFQVAPAVTLFQIISDWPELSASEEFILFEKKGDSVLFINKLKQAPFAALSFSLPLTRTDNPAVKAALHGPGTWEGVGYHNEEIIEVVREVKGSPWFFAAKIDKEDLFAPVYARARIILGAVTGLFFLLFLMLFLIILYRRRSFYKQLLKEEQEKSALKSHYEYVVKYANDIILLADEGLHIVEVNQRAAETYQYSTDEFRKIDLLRLVAPAERENAQRRLEKNENGDGYIVESVHQRKDGSLFDVEISARIIYVEGKKFLHLVIRDITERKRNEKALMESEERFRTTLYSTGDAIITTNSEGNVQYMNKVAEGLTGWAETEASGKPIDEIFRVFSEETGEELERPVEKVLRQGMVVLLSNHTCLKNRDGEEIPIGDSGAPIRDANGRITGVVLVFRDQREERKKRRELEESELHYHSLTDNTPVGIFRTRPDGYTTYVNPAWCKLSGLDAEQALGDGWLAAVHPDDRVKIAGGWHEAVRGHKISQAEYRFVRPDDQIVYVLGHTVPERNSEGEITGFVGTITDVTPQKKAEEDLLAAKNKAEESDRLKSAFLANMSHEIRTPMNGILGFMGLLEQPDLSDKNKAEFIQIINKSGERLMNTINDIIEISRIEVGDMNLHFDEVNISELMQYYYGFFKIQAEGKGILLNITEQITGTAAIVKTDKQKLDGILMNLLRNAVKFTDKGRIEFGDYLENGQLCFFVTDTGRGIPDDKTNVIFDRFVQAESGNTRGYEGAGIGLSIVKAYAGALGGRVEVKSRLGEGSTFLLSIPYEPANQPANNYSPEDVPPGKTLFSKSKILAAEDDDVNYYLLEKLLSEEVELIRAKNGEEAIRLFRETPGISLILMDIKMPGKYDGLEATREIRKLNKNVPVIAQTAYAMESDKKKAMEAGCNDYIAKPFTKDKLLSAIRKYGNTN